MSVLYKQQLDICFFFFFFLHVHVFEASSLFCTLATNWSVFTSALNQQPMEYTLPLPKISASLAYFPKVFKCIPRAIRPIRLLACYWNDDRSPYWSICYETVLGLCQVDSLFTMRKRVEDLSGIRTRETDFGVKLKMLSKTTIMSPVIYLYELLLFTSKSEVKRSCNYIVLPLFIFI